MEKNTQLKSFMYKRKKQNLVEKVANQIKLTKEKTFDKFKNAIKSKFKKKNKSKKEGENENESNEKSIESTDSLWSVQFMEKKKWEFTPISRINKNIKFNSHPIFVKLYSGVCGLTGTIGNKHDKKILPTYYELSTRKIPWNAPNRRIELLIIHCKSITERNRKIGEEVFEYHKKENPVLVIFQDLNEISDVLSLPKSKGIKNINIFNGKDEKVRPDKIAGLKGAVSLGINVWGRGTDIKNPSKPLQVIVTYFTSNTRVMYQAFGRTARQGNDGTVRIICLKSRYLSPTEILNDYSMHQVLKDFDLKNRLQMQFIQYFK